MRTEDIISKSFPRAFMGYDMQEVDVFLDQLIDQMEQMERERREMLTAMEYLLKKLENGETLPSLEQRKALRDSRRALMSGKERAVTELVVRKAQQESEKAASAGSAETAESAPAETPPAGAFVPPAAPTTPLRVRGTGKPERRERRSAEQPERVAVEYETGASAPSLEQLIPELLEQLETSIARERENIPVPGKKEPSGEDGDAV